MDYLVYCKFNFGSSELHNTLLRLPADAVIEEQTDDRFWGTGQWNSSGSGRNELGKSLMRARASIKSGVPPPPLSHAITAALGEPHEPG
eukprot:7376885-Prymnesium_polylepis.1